MIQLEVDFTLLSRFFGIPPSKIPQYANKDLEEIMEIEAQQGNKLAADYKKILSDPDKILEIFKLADVENRYIILQNMSEQDLDDLLPYLKEEQLALGLNFFTEEKLLEMCQKLPIEELVTMIFDNFNTFDVLSFMDENSMNQFLKQPEANRDIAQKYFETLDQKTLEKLMVEVYGEEMKGLKQKEYLNHLENLEDLDYQNFLLGLKRESKMFLISGMTHEEEDLLLLFEPKDLIAPMELLMKEDKIKMMGKLDKEFLVPMIQELPLDLTQIVLTQIDPRDFSEILATDFQNILESVVLFSNKMG